MTTANPLIYDIIALFQETYGFDPQGVYCQVTGKKVGSFDDSEFDALVESLAGMDREEMVDDLAMRVLASMRPSIRWNKFRAESLAALIKTHPLEGLAYLLNRLFNIIPRKADIYAARPGVNDMAGMAKRAQDGLDVVKLNRSRIRIFQHCEAWGFNDSTNTLIYMLLELDAKWNLQFEWPPFSVEDFLTAETMEHRIEMLQTWYNRRMADWSAKLKADEMQVKWETSRTGNILAKPAFMAAFLDAKPLTPTAAKKMEKAQEKAFMAGLLSEIMMGRVETVEEGQAVEPKPEFVPIRRMPLAFGVK